MIQTSINKKGEPLEKRKTLNMKKILNLSHILIQQKSDQT